MFCKAEAEAGVGLEGLWPWKEMSEAPICTAPNSDKAVDDRSSICAISRLADVTLVKIGWVLTVELQTPRGRSINHALQRTRQFIFESTSVKTCRAKPNLGLAERSAVSKDSYTCDRTAGSPHNLVIEFGVRIRMMMN